MVSKIIMIIMAVFFALGALDRLIGNKFGMGAEFEKAFIGDEIIFQNNTLIDDRECPFVGIEC